MEVGVYKGGSLYRIAEHLERNHPKQVRDRKFLGIDTFAGHPYSDQNRDPKHHYTGRFADTSYEGVKDSLKRFRFVEVIRGECGDVFPKLAQDQSFCYAHVDVDIAKSAILCTEFLYPRLSPGGILIYDEFRGYGQEQYLTEFFKDKPVKLEEREGLASGNYGLVVYRIR